MSQNSLESASEQYFIELLRTDDRLKGKNIVHSDRDAAADADAIIVEAVASPQPMVEGPKGYSVEVTITYRAPLNVTVDQNNITVAAISETISQSGPGKVPSESQFAYLLILDDSTGNRDNTQNLRRREIKINLIAKLKTQAENVISR